MHKTKKLLIYFPPWNHFSKIEGFNILGEVIKKSINNYFFTDLYDDNKNSIYYKILRKINLKFLHTKLIQVTPFSSFQNHITCNVIKNQLSNNINNIAFFLATENQFCGELAMNEILKKQVVLFIHQPKSWFKLNSVNLKYYNGVKAIFVLCKNQYNYFKENCTSPIYLIKHGVDLNIFRIKKEISKSRNKVLIVGQHLRNFTVIEKTILNVWKVNDDVEFHFVIPVRYRPVELFKLCSSDKIFFYENLSTDELASLYNQSALTFLPLIDSTANNAIIESLSCGTCVVTNNIGGVIDYLSNRHGVICNECDEITFAEAILNIIDKKVIFNRDEIRNHAELDFDWEKIVKIDILKKLEILN
jgi:glycosyltransferase involved in cell wall biosynthesis